MLRTLITEIENELDIIDDYIGGKSQLFGEFYFDGKEYYCIDSPEQENELNGDIYYEGYAICMDEIQVEESIDGAEKLEDIDFWIPIYRYESDEYLNATRVEYQTILLWDQEAKEAN